MNEQDLESLRQGAASGVGWFVRPDTLAALLAVVDAARGPARFITALRDALEPFTPAEEGGAPSSFALSFRAFNERMQETERARRLADLGIELVDPCVSDAVSSGAGGRPVSLPGAEDGPQSLSRPAPLVDRARFERDAEALLAANPSGPFESFGFDELRFAGGGLALLAEIEQAEARLARVPVLVEALRWALGGWHVFDVEQNHERYHATYALVDEWEQA